MIKNIFTVAAKELRSYLSNFVFYIVLVVFMEIWFFLFLRNVLIVGEASLRGLFDYLPWIMMVLVSAVTMGTITKEKEQGTLEVLLTHPLAQLQLVLGKWIACFIYVSSIFLFTIPIAISMSRVAGFDFGMYVGQLMGGLLFSAAYTSVGLFISTLVENQIAAMLLTAATGFIAFLIGTEFVTANVPLVFSPVLERLSFSSHVNSLARGVVDTRDVWYFVSVCLVFQAFSVLYLIRQKYGNRKSSFRSLQAGVLLFTAIVILTNILGERIPGRVDLTSGGLYTLSAPTKKILKELPDVMTVTVFSSSRLPPQLAPVVRETIDILKDFRDASGGKLTLILKDPSADSQAAHTASTRGIQEVQFNLIGSQELQLKTGYLGLTIEYATKYETIPFIKDTNDLEYNLTSLIRKLTINEKKKIAFITGHGEKNLFRDYKQFNQEASKVFEFVSDSKVATGASAILIAGPTQKYDAKLIEDIRGQVVNGVGLLIFNEPYSVSTQNLSAKPNETNVSDIVSDLGITFEKNLVYDLKFYELVSFSNPNQNNILMPYPFWMRVADSASGNSKSTSGKGKGILFPWADSITINEDKVGSSGYEIRKRFVTSDYAGIRTGDTQVSPSQSEFSKTDLRSRTISAQLIPKEKNGKGTVTVAGTSKFIEDNFLQNSPDNLTFALGLLSQASGDASDLDSSLARKAGVAHFRITNALDALFIRYSGLVIAAVIPLLFACFYLYRRRLMRYRKYEFTT